MSSDSKRVLTELRSVQRAEWQKGNRVSIESFQGLYSSLSHDQEAVLDAIYAEVCLREEYEESPALDEYLTRFPHLEAELRKLFEVHDAIGNLADLGLPDDGRHSVAEPAETKSLANQTPRDHRAEIDYSGKPYLLSLQIAHFELREVVGRGQFGEVWRAWDSRLNREVALKLPRRHSFQHDAVRGFLHEARAAANLAHPNIVPVFEVGTEGDAIYIASQFVSGVTLQSYLGSKRLTAREAAQLAFTIAQALAHAHERGVVHRDLKPGNIMVDAQSCPLIADFGVAKHSRDDVTITIEGRLIGTPAYMAPEQARGDGHLADGRADVYSLGVILYEMLAGKRPFQGNLPVLLQRVLTQDPDSLRRDVPAIPKDLETICLKAMEKDPAQRYQSATALADDLERFLNDTPIHARPQRAFEKAMRWTRRNRWSVASATAIGGALVTIGFLMAAAPASRPNLGHAVVLDTEPTGARVVFYPLHEKTGEPLPEKAIDAGTSPVSAVLAPGDYLVVAASESDGFHEVFRHVPESPEAIPFAARHQRWSFGENGEVVLPSVQLFKEPTGTSMVLVEASSEPFRLQGLDYAKAQPPTFRMTSFLVDPHECSVGDYQRLTGYFPKVRGNRDLPLDHPARLQYDEAVYAAERLGKRLLSEAEFAYLSTNGGTSRYPWGDDLPDTLPLVTLDTPVHQSAFDRLTMMPEVLNLHSNVPEWTSTWDGHYPGYGLDNDLAPTPGDRRVIRGALLDAPSKARNRAAVSHLVGGFHKAIGARFGRSVAPRLSPQDFVQLTPPPTPVSREQLQRLMAKEPK